ncbi:uncharacterized protein B0I36DRAFT_432652 [Microdochium trichocladiopsis]|uniref:Uncharacterized protein n=1 Tax=Microdochium trichocladiopsis TaxID=1682393 RepID=A0A9P8Y2Q0_9PEZI|nr:uncharacterized protein B0I36DRAFT_432652 [Microdochium trichocladiopsis]KAH7027374.1 hypothetical protein B0I36DRAFT_432652 [Microdochium trichocladiopsis]
MHFTQKPTAQSPAMTTISLSTFISTAIAGLAAAPGVMTLGVPASPLHTSILPPQPEHIQVFCRNETEIPIFTYGDHDNGGPGLLIWNYDPYPHSGIGGTMFLLYESNHDLVPYKFSQGRRRTEAHLLTGQIQWIPPWSSAFITVCPTFEGRVVRGDWSYFDGHKHMLGTWVEVAFTSDGMVYGDISLLEGNDGAAMIQSMDGFHNAKGFTFDLLESAPRGAWAQKSSGTWCLDKIIGLDANYAAWAWQSEFLDPWNVYLTNEVNPVIDSVNGRFQITFYDGAI